MTETFRLVASVVALSGLAVDALSIFRLAEDIKQAPSDIQSLTVRDQCYLSYLHTVSQQLFRSK